MSHDTAPAAAGTDSCRTTDSFDDHAIPDGSVLLTRTHYRLVDAGVGSFEPTERFYESLETAFIWAYLGATDGADVPAHVRAALDDALAATRDDFADRSAADLRTDVLPHFYRTIAAYHCAYRD